jgi:hypothetical protein
MELLNRLTMAETAIICLLLVTAVQIAWMELTGWWHDRRERKADERRHAAWRSGR